MRLVMTGKTQICLEIPIFPSRNLPCPSFGISWELLEASTEALREWQHSEGVFLASIRSDYKIMERNSKCFFART